MTEPVEKAHGQLSSRTRASRSKTSAVIALLYLGAMTIATPGFGCLTAGPDAHAATSESAVADVPANALPSILGVTAAADRLQPLDVCRLVCEADDDDGDPLTYRWTASQGDITGQGATVEWSAPDAEGLYRVSVTVDDGRGGTDESSISIRVRNNTAPQFQSVSTPEGGVRPGAAVEISCSATDSDGDEISYEWQAGHGAVQGEGASAVWIVPEKPGSYVITVSARDAYGGETRRDVLINVTLSPTPRLGPFVVEAIDHDLLKYEAGAWDTYLGQLCRVGCIVLEGDQPLAYSWTVDKGTLVADGAVATWTAPDERGPATITVAVTDARGNTNTGQVLMFVEDCTCVFK